VGSADDVRAEVDERRKPLRHGRVLFRAAHRERSDMGLLHWALVFLVVALIAAVLGFAGIAAAAAGIARILFIIFIVIFLVLLIMHLLHGRPPRVP
jgi:uncharacterized membrane protein YtjA (UPF0391 family)